MCDRCLSSVISTAPVLVIIGILVLILPAILRICWCRTVISPARPPSTSPPELASIGDGSSSAYAGGGSWRSGPVEDAADRMVADMNQQLESADDHRRVIVSVVDRALKQRDDYIKWHEQIQSNDATIEAQKATIESQAATIASQVATIANTREGQGRVANLREDHEGRDCGDDGRR